MNDVYESIVVQRNQYSNSYEGCSDCIHEGDTIEICKMRECVHAFSVLKDCYIPKKSVNEGSECVRFADIRPFGDDFCSRGERRE